MIRIKIKNLNFYNNPAIQHMGGVTQCATALSAGGTFDKFYR